MKHVFKARWGWNDRFDEGNYRKGDKIPTAVITPGGHEIPLDDVSIGGTLFDHQETHRHKHGRKSRATYAPMGHGVKARIGQWPDNELAYRRTVGNASKTLEVLAPKGSKFIYASDDL